jgi:hypothetical protein
MPRKDDSQHTHRQDGADAHGGPLGRLGGHPGDRTEAAQDTWLDNPRNLQAFFDAIERARRAKGQRSP